MEIPTASIGTKISLCAQIQALQLTEGFFSPSSPFISTEFANIGQCFGGHFVYGPG